MQVQLLLTPVQDLARLQPSMRLTDRHKPISISAACFIQKKKSYDLSGATICLSDASMAVIPMRVPPTARRLIIVVFGPCAPGAHHLSQANRRVRRKNLRPKLRFPERAAK